MGNCSGFLFEICWNYGKKKLLRLYGTSLCSHKLHSNNYILMVATLFTPVNEVLLLLFFSQERTFHLQKSITTLINFKKRYIRIKNNKK